MVDLAVPPSGPAMKAFSANAPFIDGRIAATWAAIANGADSVRAVAEITSVSVSTAHHRIVDARRMGLIDFADGHKGTLRSVVTVVR